MKILRFATCMILIAALMAPSAMAAPAPLRGPAVAADVQGNRVSTQEVGGEHYLFLPSAADLTALTLSFEGGSAVLSVGGREIGITSGQPFDLASLYSETPDDGIYSFTVRQNSGQMTVKVMVSNSIGSMYITSDDPAGKGRTFVEQVKGNKATGRMTFIGADGRVIYSGGLTQIKGRGNATWVYWPKKPYQIKLEKKSDLLENGETAKTWVLLANYNDQAFIRNSLTYDLAAALGLPYSPHTSPVDLYYDGEYRGTYLLSEKTEIGSSRVDIHDLEGDYEDANPEVKDFDGLPTAMGTNCYGNTYQYVTGLTDPEDLSGGYLLEVDYADRAKVEKSWFTTSQGYYLVSKSPEYLSETAMEYISGFYQEFEDAVWNGGINPTTGKSYTDYVDLQSLARYYLILELSQDGDAFLSSTFFYKPEGEDKLYAGPVWDFDQAYSPNYDTTAIVTGTTRIGRKLLELPSFCEAVEDIYENELNRLITDVILSTDPEARDGRLRSIPGYSAEIAASQRMNNILWSKGGPEVLPNAAETLRNFICRRNQFLYEQDFTKLAEELPRFLDVPKSKWYYSSVEYVVENGLFSGYSDNYFGPEDSMTRAMAATVLYLHAGSPKVENGSSFGDVPQDQWYSNAVEWAAGSGIVAGHPDGNFYPDKEITRQELVTMLYHYAEYAGVDLTAPGIPDRYLDRDSVASWAVDAIAWSLDRGIISGTSETSLSPDGNALRYMAAVIFQHYNGIIEADT